MTNRWWEITVKTKTELEETVFWRLQEFGCQGTATVAQTESLIIKGYVPAMKVDSLDLAALSFWLRQDFMLAGAMTPAMNWELIDEEDWLSDWKENWKPVEVGDRLLIYPAWLELQETSDKLILQLDPGTVFGDGEHPTTQLCLESLEMRLEDEEEEEFVIADIGCGTGILSIAAMLLGAKEVYAVDIEPLAVKATQENSLLNKIKHIHVVQGSVKKIREMTDKKIDGIVCNILSEVIEDLIPQMTELIHPKSWGILSGVLVEQSSSVLKILEQNDWVIAALWKREDWCCINIRRQ